MKKIIINADDYGLNPHFNKGICDAIKNGVVSSVSVMINRNYLDIEKLLVFEDISIGVHLEIEENCFFEDIERQILKFKNIFNSWPSHLDGHQHCHILPGNIEKVIKAAKKYNLPVRSRFDEDRKLLIENGIKTPDRFISWHPERIFVLKERLEIESGEIIEMVCHPGYESGVDIKYNKQREKELNFLKSDDFAKAINKFDIINYYGF